MMKVSLILGSLNEPVVLSDKEVKQMEFDASNFDRDPSFYLKEDIAKLYVGNNKGTIPVAKGTSIVYNNVMSRKK